MLTTFVLKLFLTPTLTGIVSYVGRRWGPSIGGWLVGLPLTSGPVVLFLALEQGSHFAAITAQATLFGIISVAAFCLVYSWLSLKWSWQGSILGGWAAFFVFTLILDQFSVPLIVSILAVFAALVIALRLFPATQPTETILKSPSWEIPARMVLATGFVLLITGVANLLGPQLSGLITPFPIYATILSTFTHHFQGRGAAIKLLRGVVTGTFAFVVFFVVIAGVIEQVGIALAFGLAIPAALSVQGFTFWLMQQT